LGARPPDDGKAGVVEPVAWPAFPDAISAGRANRALAALACTSPSCADEVDPQLRSKTAGLACGESKRPKLSCGESNRLDMAPLSPRCPDGTLLGRDSTEPGSTGGLSPACRGEARRQAAEDIIWTLSGLLGDRGSED
jgi:hypothetical protein